MLPPSSIKVFMIRILLSLLCGLSSANAANLKPNIVIIMVDDMGIGDTSAYLGKSLSERSAPIELTQVTPSLEAFASRSMIFTDAHAGGSMCSTSRYSCLLYTSDAADES